MIQKFRKKPVVIEAIEFTEDNMPEIVKFFHLNPFHITKDNLTGKTELIIKTLEGDMLSQLGDYIIKGVAGEFYPCRRDIFEKTYEAVND